MEQLKVIMDDIQNSSIFFNFFNFKPLFDATSLYNSTFYHWWILGWKKQKVQKTIVLLRYMCSFLALLSKGSMGKDHIWRHLKSKNGKNFDHFPTSPNVRLSSNIAMQEEGEEVSTLSIAIKTFISIQRREDLCVEQIHVWAQSYHSFSIILFIFFWLRVWSRFTVLITTTWNILQMTGHEFIALLQCILLLCGYNIWNEIPYHTLVE